MNKLTKKLTGTALLFALSAGLCTTAFAGEPASSEPAFGMPANSSVTEEADEPMDSVLEDVTADIEAEEPSRLDIVLFGYTPEEGSDYGVSKTISICSFDNENKQIRISTILDNVDVEIADHGTEAIGNAYKYGGAETAISTLNDVFGLELNSYLALDNSKIAKAIDIADGVEFELTEEEAQAINEETGSELTAGVNTLDGDQAVAYAATPATGKNAILADKWRDVMGKLFEKMSTMEMNNRLAVAFELLSSADSSVTVEDVMKLASFPFDEYEVKECVIPDYSFEEDLSVSQNEEGIWKWSFDMDAAANRLKDFVTNPQFDEEDADAEEDASDELIADGQIFTGKEMTLTSEDGSETVTVKELSQGGWAIEDRDVILMEDINDASIFHGNDGSTWVK